jgi:hypothetical protein
MTVNKGVAVGVCVPAVVLGSVLVAQYCGPKLFAEAAARGNIVFAERISGILVKLSEPAFNLLIAATCLGFMAIGSTISE